MGNVQCLLLHGKLCKEFLRRAHGVYRGGWNICYESMPCCSFGCGVLVRVVSLLYWSQCLVTSPYPVVSSCCFFLSFLLLNSLKGQRFLSVSCRERVTLVLNFRRKCTILVKILGRSNTVFSVTSSPLLSHPACEMLLC